VVLEMCPVIEQLVGESTLLRRGQAARSVEIRVKLDDGRQLIGTVGNVYGDLLHTVGYSRIGAKHRMAAWVELLALSAAYPEVPWRAATLGRARSDMAPYDMTECRIGALAPDAEARGRLALELLGRVIDLYDRGMRGPVPLFRKSSAAYALAVAQDRDPVRKARGEWESDRQRSGEDQDPAHRLVFGGVLPLEELLEEQPRSDESGPGWVASESNRFGRYARRLWDDLLDREEISDG
jgi:exodeoxyribonuclease V gamma subunit